MVRVYYLPVCWAVLSLFGSIVSGRVTPGSRLIAREKQAWISDNETFAFGFAETNSRNNQFQLGIWFYQLPSDRTFVWSPDINSPVSKDAILEFQPNGNLVLTDGSATFWSSNSTTSGSPTAAMSDNGNFIIYGPNQTVAWQSFSHPSDTLLPGQPLTADLELTSSKSSSRDGYYTLKMQQQPTSLSLALTYNLPESPDSPPEPLSNFSYWSGPDISNVTGDVFAVMDDGGSFGIVYGSSADGAVYVYKNDNDSGGLSAAMNRTSSPVVIRRLILEANGNLRMYRWDNDVNGSRQWVAEWAAESNPCNIAGICGNGICNLDRSKTNASCSCLPGTADSEEGISCYGNSSEIMCGANHENVTPNLKMSVLKDTNYYFSESSVIANYSDEGTVSKCGDACLSDCDCVASVYGLNEEKPYCWILRRLDFGGYEDLGSTVFVKVDSDGDGLTSEETGKVVVLPIVLSITVLIGLLVCMLYINVRRKRKLRRALESSLIVSGQPISFSYRDLQFKTSNFSQLLGTGGFGSVYKGSLSDGTLIAVKKLDRILPHGEKEFITEVNTISSMHHMNLVRLWGYCSEGIQRLLVYEFMKNGSLDKWIFSSSCSRILDWETRFQVAVGTAQGIAYFHEQCRDRIIHCDIKPENILLDDNFKPKVSDFGLAKMMGREASRVVTMIRGTRGYLAPEWVSNRPITVKADVYSYGMLLLEIIGGRRNLDMSYDTEDFFYPGWAFKEMKMGRAAKAADRRLEGAVEEVEVARALGVAFWCIQDEIAVRPTMGDVVKMLEGSVEINEPPMPQAVVELIEEGLDNVYKAMKREFNHYSSFTITTHPSSSHATSEIQQTYIYLSPRFFADEKTRFKKEGMEQLQFADGLVKEFLVYRGFTSTLQAFEKDLATDIVGKGFQVDDIMNLIFGVYVPQYEAAKLIDLLIFFSTFTNSDQKWIDIAAKLQQSVLRYYVVYCLKHEKRDAVLELFEYHGKGLARTDPISERDTVKQLQQEIQHLSLKLSQAQTSLKEKEAQSSSGSNDPAVDSRSNDDSQSFKEVSVTAPTSRNATIHCGTETMSLEWDCRSNNLLLMGTSDGCIKAWNADAKRFVCDLKSSKAYPRQVSGSSESSDSLGFASLTVWDLKSWKAVNHKSSLLQLFLKAVLPLGKDPPAITSLSFNRSGRLLAAAGTGGSIHMFGILTLYLVKNICFLVFYTYDSKFITCSTKYIPLLREDMSSCKQLVGWTAHRYA
ncbi:hypothetical protein SASPL_152936 [Salvia splendens]|uniref:non-specific serine/threonine protein kinase n=1 Tax=Salvia splendens TaxID=180675 RepID=A0A8X8W4M6_SALSN|nr:hypothetical protein SASPL_152936 [Salvia splendens]